MTCCIAEAISKHKVGDHVLVKLSAGRIVEATVKAIVEKTDGVRFQVSFGNETALIYPWQIVTSQRNSLETQVALHSYPQDVKMACDRRLRKSAEAIAEFLEWEKKKTANPPNARVDASDTARPSRNQR